MDTMELLKRVKQDLLALGLPIDKVPLMEEVRKVYKANCPLHPDKVKTGDAEKFKVITEAVRHVMDFLSENPELQSEAEVEDFGDVLKGFVKSNDVAYNTSSIVFTIVDNTREAWVKSLEKRLGTPETKTTGLIFRKDNWTMPSGSEMFDKIVVTVYNTDKKVRTATVMFQGKSYVPYMTFVVPEVLKEIKAEEVRAIQVDKKNLLMSLPLWNTRPSVMTLNRRKLLKKLNQGMKQNLSML